jgi:hypothetical protein
MMMDISTFAVPGTFEHDMDHGFCTVCGAVWPCSHARHAMASDGTLSHDGRYPSRSYVGGGHHPVPSDI